MKLYIIRHGQTDYNIKKIIQGTLPTVLNEEGINQVLNLKKQIENLNIDLIISSPLMRTLQTVQILNENRNIEVITDSRLEDRGFGKMVGQKEFPYTDNINLYWDEKQNYADDNGIETVKNLLKRTEDFLNDIKKQYQDKNILIVTHGSVVASFCHLLGLEKNELDITNCTLMKFEI